MPLPKAEPDSVDGALSEVGMPLALIDLQLLPEESAARRWLSVPRTMRLMNLYPPYDQLRSFDALFYVDEVTPSPHQADDPARSR